MRFAIIAASAAAAAAACFAAVVAAATAAILLELKLWKVTFHSMQFHCTHNLRN